jgi:hypothetical protein
MQIATPAFLTLALMACSGTNLDKGDTAQTTSGRCANNILERHPADGAADVYHRARTDRHFALSDSSARIVLTDASGSEVAGTDVNDGNYVGFVPDEPLESGATYTSTLSWACDPDITSFTVSDQIGEAVDSASLEGRSWALDLREGREVNPLGINAALEQLIEFDLILGYDRDGTKGAFRMVGAISDKTGNQDVCAPFIPFENNGDLTANPYFTLTSNVLPIYVDGALLEIDDLEMSGSFTADGTEIQGLELSGVIDTRPLAGVIDEKGTGDAESVCELFSGTFNFDCEACPGGDGDYCIFLELDDLKAEETGFAVMRTTDADIASNPECD